LRAVHFDKQVQPSTPNCNGCNAKRRS
jgi:hypothetical protein